MSIRNIEPRTLNAPLLRTISLPSETYPFSLHLMLSPKTPVIFNLDSPVPPCSSVMTPDPDLDCPATHPATQRLRIVHPLLDAAIVVHPSSLQSPYYVSVRDVFAAIHRFLVTPLDTNSIPSIRRADILSYHRLYLRTGPPDTRLRKVHLLEGACEFGGLHMNVAESNKVLGTIDEMQALTWILLTREQTPSYATPSYTVPYTSPATYSPTLYYSHPTSVYNEEDEAGASPFKSPSPSKSRVRFAPTIHSSHSRR